MIGKMSSSISIRLLICIAVFLPWCFRGCGIGCAKSSRLSQDDYFKNTDFSTRFQYLNIQDVEESIQVAIKQMSIDSNLEELLTNAGLYVKLGSPAYGQLIDSQPSAEGHLESLSAEIIVKASEYLVESYCSKDIFGDSLACAKQLTQMKLTRTSMGEKCMSMFYDQTACVGKNLKYRTIDGSCNNLKRSFLGKANTAYKRLLFPDYNNGVSELKKLPNPRKMSTSLVNDENSPDNMKTIAMAYWAAFISHDLSKTAVSTMLKTNKSVICCPEDRRLEVPKLRHRSCASITIPEFDRLNTSPIGEGCMNYVRSVPAMRTDCTFGPREQMNVVTHYLDGSMIYGSSVQQTWSLRSKSRGQLLTQTDGRPHFMPAYMPLDRSSTACQFGPGTCYMSGDSRANAQPQLMLMHTLWLREHNRLANQLASVNRHWDDERTFQEARKIVIASIQHITYNEWLPALLGRDYTMRNKLELLSKGYSDAYDETADPSVSNGFATAVLPFVNSMYDETIRLYSKSRVTDRSLSLKKHYNRPSDLMTYYVDNLIIGLSMQSTQKVDMKFSETMTDFLFNIGSDNNFGMDVMSLTIQRSRDHGIPSYVEYRKYCGLNDVSNERDLNNVMVEGAMYRLMNQYKTVKDIELFIGALFEKHEGDSMVGPTMRCIIREQFIRTRIADSYFYDLPKVFSGPQLAEIRNMSLARLLCDNDDYDVNTMQRKVFFKPGSENKLLLCESDSIPKININPWSERV